MRGEVDASASRIRFAALQCLDDVIRVLCWDLLPPRREAADSRFFAFNYYPCCAWYLQRDGLLYRPVCIEAQSEVLAALVFDGYFAVKKGEDFAKVLLKCLTNSLTFFVTYLGIVIVSDHMVLVIVRCKSYRSDGEVSTAVIAYTHRSFVR
jgi:hypothetical protein